MRKGIRTLANGSLKKWSVKMTRSRGLREDTFIVPEIVQDAGGGSDSEGEDMWDTGDDENDTSTQGDMTLGIMHSKGGDFVIEYEGDGEDNACTDVETCRA